jgi:hypothetical protein
MNWRLPSAKRLKTPSFAVERRRSAPRRCGPAAGQSGAAARAAAVDETCRRRCAAPRCSARNTRPGAALLGWTAARPANSQQRGQHQGSGPGNARPAAIWLLARLRPRLTCLWQTPSSQPPTPPAKVGIVGKYGTRYGASLRKQIKKMEVSQHSKYFCNFCGKVREILARPGAIARRPAPPARVPAPSSAGGWPRAAAVEAALGSAGAGGPVAVAAIGPAARAVQQRARTRQRSASLAGGGPRQTARWRRVAAGGAPSNCASAARKPGGRAATLQASATPLPLTAALHEARCRGHLGLQGLQEDHGRRRIRAHVSGHGAGLVPPWLQPSHTCRRAAQRAAGNG